MAHYAESSFSFLGYIWWSLYPSTYGQAIASAFGHYESAITLWYGGKSLIKLNYDNRLRIENIQLDYIHEDVTTTRNQLSAPKSLEQPQSNIDLIRSLDSDKLQTIILARHIASRYIQYQKIETETSQIRFHTLDEVEDYLRRQDLGDLLDIPQGKNFCCLFHDDHHPSANIYLDQREGKPPYWYYKCRSTYCKNNNGLDIISFVEKLADTKRHIARKFLMKVFNVEFIESDWSKERKLVLEDNIRTLKHDDWLRDTYPYTYKRFKKHVDKLLLLNLHGQNRIFTEQHTDVENNPIFRASQSEMMKILQYSSKQNDKMNKILNLFIFCHLLNKLSDDQIPSFLLNDAKQWAINHGHNKHTSFYSIPAYSNKTFEMAEEKSRSINQRKLKMDAFTREGIKRTFGESEANRVFPQLEDREYSEASRDFESELDKVLSPLVMKNGYTTMKEVLQHIPFNPNKYLTKNGSVMKTIPSKQNFLDRMLPEALDKYGLQKVRANNKLKEQFHIESNGYPSIIIPL